MGRNGSKQPSFISNNNNNNYKEMSPLKLRTRIIDREITNVTSDDGSIW